MRARILLATLVAAASVGCSTTQDVTLAKSNYGKRIASAAIVADKGNSVEMTANLQEAVRNQGITLKPSMPAETRTAPGVDALVSYVDVWRWDFVMFLARLEVKMFDAASGDLIAIGSWKDSPAHGWRDSRVVMNGLLSEMVTKLNEQAAANGAPPTTATSK